MPNCLICSEPFEAKRSTTVVCRKSRCQMAHYRSRKRAKSLELEVLTRKPSEHELLIAKFEMKLPELGKELRTIQAIYGEKAVARAINAVNIVGNHLKPHQRTYQSSAPLPPAA